MFHELNLGDLSFPHLLPSFNITRIRHQEFHYLCIVAVQHYPHFLGLDPIYPPYLKPRGRDTPICIFPVHPSIKCRLNPVEVKSRATAPASWCASVRNRTLITVSRYKSSSVLISRGPNSKEKSYFTSRCTSIQPVKFYFVIRKLRR